MWNDAEPDVTFVAGLLKDMATLKPRLSESPDNFARLGRFLSGRVNIAAGNLAKAVEELKHVSEVDGNPKAVACKKE